MMISALSPANRSNVMFKGYSRAQWAQIVTAKIAKMNDALALFDELNKPNDQTNLFCREEYDQMDGKYYAKDSALFAMAEQQLAELIRKAPQDVVRQIDARLSDSSKAVHYTPSDEVFQALFTRLS